MTLGISIQEDLKEFAGFHENDEKAVEDMQLVIDEAAKEIVNNADVPKEEHHEEEKKGDDERKETLDQVTVATKEAKYAAKESGDRLSGCDERGAE